MNARVKRVMVKDAVDKDGLIVVMKLKKRAMFDRDGKFAGWIRRVIVDRPNKDWPHKSEAAAERKDINEGIDPERSTPG